MIRRFSSDEQIVERGEKHAESGCIFCGDSRGTVLSGAYAQSVQPTLLPKPQAVNATPAPVPPANPALGAQPLAADNVNAWLDGYMPISIGRADIPGAVVVVVKDGQILTSRGYGYADVDKRKAVDPHTTLFRPGSMSKLFTWTAVMQLVEQGKLNLDEDVNKYLDFKIPPRNGKPITLRNIMTHTAGFEEQVMDLIAIDPKKYVPTTTSPEALGAETGL